MPSTNINHGSGLRGIFKNFTTSLCPPDSSQRVLAYSRRAVPGFLNPEDEGKKNEFKQVSVVDAVCPDVVHFGCGAGA